MPKKIKTKNKGSVPTEYAEVKVDHGIFEDYLQYGSQYDTVNGLSSYTRRNGVRSKTATGKTLEKHE